MASTGTISRLWRSEGRYGGGPRRPAVRGPGQNYAGHGAGQTIKPQDPELSKRLMQGPELSRAFMLRWDLYRQYFPLMALGRALRRRPAQP